MRIIRFVLLFLICLLPISVEAHTSLKSSNPAEGSALSEPVDRIRLTFSEAVEKTSTLRVVDANGVEQALAKPLIIGNELSAVVSEPLTEGKYTIKWASISDDGHPVKGTIRFTVLGAAKAETSTVEKAEPMETKASVVPEAEPVSKGLVPTLLPWVVGGLLISIVILLLLRRRTT